MKKLREAIGVLFGCLGVLWVSALVYMAFGWLGGGR